jgi:hydrogenase maturation protease
MRTLVIGLGNPILTDDGVGIWTARAVAEALPPDAPIDVIELSVGGLSLMEAMVGYQHVVLIDAIKTRDGVPGQVYHIGMDNLPETMNTASVHDANLATALRLGRSLGAVLPADDDIDVIAVEAVDVLTFGDTPIPAVADAVPVAAGLVLDVLAFEGLIERPTGGVR